jgi:predicted ATP-dependent endonuclease of OLD family
MVIQRLTINHYKSIEQTFDLQNPGRLHIFIGSNNAGKTNILDAIDQLRDGDDVRFTDLKADLSVTMSVTSRYGKKLEISQSGSMKKFMLDGQPLTTTRGKEIVNRHTIRISATMRYDLATLRRDYRSFQQQYPSVFKDFSQVIARHIPQIALIEGFGNNKIIQEDSESHPFERLGDGFRQVFMILMYLYHPQYSLLLLEEPEIHLHPALIKRLLKVIESERYENQIFMTTHSPLFIHPTNLHRVFRVTREGDSTRVYSPRLSGHQLNYGRLTQELNADNCEMFFADKVLLVEGPSDHILMRGLIDRFYTGPKDIKVIQVYGKSNIDVYAELLQVFNIPYAIMLDQDALYDTGVKLIQHQPHYRVSSSEPELIRMLKQQSVFILPNGSIEKNYPHRYQRQRKHKPLSALYAAWNITEAEYRSFTMRYLREVIESL